MTDSLGSDACSARDVGQALRERGWRQAYTINEQVDSWAQLVSGVVDGYHLTIDDYTNDLSVREWLEEAGSLLVEPVRASLVERLKPLDAQFFEATLEPLDGRLPGVGPHWWSRLPKRLVGELAEDVERLGLSQSGSDTEGFG